MFHMTEESAQDRALQYEPDAGIPLPIPKDNSDYAKEEIYTPRRVSRVKLQLSETNRLKVATMTKFTLKLAWES